MFIFKIFGLIIIQFLLLKRTKFAGWAKRRMDEGLGMKNNNWNANIAEHLDKEYEEFVTEMTKDIIDRTPNCGIPENWEEVNQVIDKYQPSHSDQTTQNIVDNPTVILLNADSDKFKSGKT